ncbi:hypothetical protein GCM10009567_12310 [Rothia amarae]
MQIEEITKILVSLTGLGTALIPVLEIFRNPVNKRESLLKLLEIRAQYPANDPMATDIDNFIRTEMNSIYSESQATRSPIGI